MAAALPGFLSGAVQAATVVWQEPVSGSFNNAQRWLVANSFPEERRLPTAGDDIQIIAGPAITVDVPGGATVANADIGETVTLNLSGTLAVTGRLDGAPAISGAGKVTAAEWRVGAPTPSLSGATADVGSLKLTGNGYGINVQGGGTLKAGAYNGPNTFGRAPLSVDGENSNFTLTSSLEELAAPGLEIRLSNSATATLGAVNRAGAFFLEDGAKLTAGFFQPRHVAVRSGSTLTTGEAKPLGFGPVSGFGVAEVSRSTWNIGGKLTLSGSTLRVTDGGRMQAQSVDLTDFARLQVGNAPFPQGGPNVVDDGVLTVSGAVMKNAGTLSVLGGGLACDSMNLLGEGAMQGESGLTASAAGINIVGAAVLDTTGTLEASTVDAQTCVIGSSAGRRGQITMSTCEFRVKESLVIGQAGSGSLLANAPFRGPAVAPSIVLGAAATASGSMEMSGGITPGTDWDFAGALVIGDAGEGTLTIRQSSALFASANNLKIAKQPGSRGTVRVIGNTAFWSVMPLDPTGAAPVVIGEGGRGTLSIESAEVKLLNCTIGRSGEDNICQVSGPHPGDAITRNLDVPATLIVGDGGRGTLSFNAGATAHAGKLIAGRQSSADNRVTLGNGCLFFAGFGGMIIGDSGKARFDISGSADSSGRLAIARGDGSQGSVTVSGNGANLRAVAIDMGGKPQARATLNLQAGTETEIGELLAPVPPTGQADISINGAETELRITNRLRLGRIGQASGPVTCNISGGARVSVGNEILVRKNARLAATGSAVLAGQGTPPLPGILVLRTGARLAGDGTIASPRVEVETTARIAPGAALGTLTIEGDVLMQPASVLELEISGLTAPAAHDYLHATGYVTVGGIVELKFINGYAPKAGDRFCFVRGDAGLAFAPTGVVVSGLAPGFTWTLSGDANEYCITANNTAQPDSKPEITINRNTDDGVSLNWSSESWKLESAEDPAGNWQSVQSPPGGEGSFTLDVPVGDGARFWRLKQ